MAPHNVCSPRMKVQAAITFGVLILYWFTSVGHYIGGDQAIFVTVAIDGGYAHAPGYPLYSMYLYATNWGDNPWLATSRATAVLGALAAGILYRAMRAWAVPNAMAIFATLIWAFAPQVWFYHTQAEVFAGNNLAVAAILWACAPGQSKRHALHTFALGLLAGLAISHHHTAVFMAPLGLWKTWTLIKDQPRNALLGLLGLATGLLPYLWLPYVHIYHYDRWHWGAPANLDGFLHVFLRKDYGTFTMTVDEEITYIPLKQWTFLATNSAKNLLAIIPIAAVFAAIWAWRERHIPRAPLAALIVSTILAGPFFVALMHREPIGLNTLLVSKFHLMALTLLIFVLTTCVHQLLRDEARKVALVGAMGLLIQASIALSYLSPHQEPAPHYYLEDLWGSLPEDAMLIAAGDHVTAGSWAYLRSTEDTREVIAPHLLVYPWYHARIERLYGISAKVDGIVVDDISLVTALQSKGYRVFLSEAFPIVQRRPSYPWGITIYLVGANENMPRPDELMARNLELYKGFRYEGNMEGFWSERVRYSYASTWLTLAATFEQKGDETNSQKARQMSTRYGAD